jgi:hypothetical protein
MELEGVHTYTWQACYIARYLLAIFEGSTWSSGDKGTVYIAGDGDGDGDGDVCCFILKHD